MALQGRPSGIIVMGATGTGKSTFINLVSGSTLSVSGGLRSCTSEVLESRPFDLDGQSVILIDTPGFDDTTRPDTDIITTISTYLASIHKQGVKLSGVIYMHRISDMRMGGTSLLNFRIFRELCGNESLHSALIVTTMWSGADPGLEESRERELATADDLFKPVLDGGARLVRHDGTLESAQAILHLLITDKGTTLRIQRELVDEGKELVDTAAGAELTRLFTEQAGRLETRSRRVHKQMEDALLAEDHECWTILQLELDEMQKEKRRFEDENERLRRMTPSALDTVSTELVERLGGRPYLYGNLQVGFPARGQARTEFQEQLSKLQTAGKRTKHENQRLQGDAHAVSDVLEQLKTRSKELYDDLQAVSQSRVWDRQYRIELARVDQILEEMRGMQRQIDVATERQSRIMAEMTKHQERSGRTYLSIYDAFKALGGWLTF